MIRRSNLDGTKGKDKNNINSQVQSERTKHLFDLDQEWLKESFMPHEQDSVKKIYEPECRRDKTHDCKQF